MHLNPIDIDIDLDAELAALEREWRASYDASIAARGVYQMLAANLESKVAELDEARERLDRAEAQQARVMQKIERLESRLVGGT